MQIEAWLNHQDLLFQNLFLSNDRQTATASTASGQQDAQAFNSTTTTTVPLLKIMSTNVKSEPGAGARKSIYKSLRKNQMSLTMKEFHGILLEADDYGYM